MRRSAPAPHRCRPAGAALVPSYRTGLPQRWVGLPSPALSRRRAPGRSLGRCRCRPAWRGERRGDGRGIATQLPAWSRDQSTIHQRPRPSGVVGPPACTGSFAGKPNSHFCQIRRSQARQFAGRDLAHRIGNKHRATTPATSGQRSPTPGRRHPTECPARRLARVEQGSVKATLPAIRSSRRRWRNGFTGHDITSASTTRPLTRCAVHIAVCCVPGIATLPVRSRCH